MNNSRKQDKPDKKDENNKTNKNEQKLPKRDEQLKDIIPLESPRRNSEKSEKTTERKI